MGGEQIRRELLDFISRVDERALYKIYDAVMRANEFEADAVSDVIVGYELTGKPITRTELIKQIKEAEEEIAKGEYITQEDLERELEEW